MCFQAVLIYIVPDIFRYAKRNTRTMYQTFVLIHVLVSKVSFNNYIHIHNIFAKFPHHTPSGSCSLPTIRFFDTQNTLHSSMLSTPSGSLVQNFIISLCSERTCHLIYPLQGKDVISASQDTTGNFSTKYHSLPYASHSLQDTQNGKS